MDCFRNTFTLTDYMHPVRQAIAGVQRSVDDNPNVSIRHGAHYLNLCSSTSWKILL